MRKIFNIIIILAFALLLVSCDKDEESVDETFELLMQAEELSGMKAKTNTTITEAGSLGLPTEYKGVAISYKSRSPEIITDQGVVILPEECWIESRDQKGQVNEEFKDINNDWPVVLDVTLSYNGQTRSAKLLFVVAPVEGFTCDKYLG
ncbi:MAG: hypothetical protein PHX62_02740 [Bacilli bacterium]|nr:hypothetical protein [Bacilli bacterium]